MSTTTKQPSRIFQILTTGFAMFSMFFGAGNVVFPLMVGQQTTSLVWPAIMGLLLTGVGVPFVGLLAMVLFDGDYKSFFDRMGVLPGFLVTLFIMILIGPVSAMPRCVALSHGAMQLVFPQLDLFTFSIISAITIYLLTARKSGVVDVLGQYLSPVLIVSLFIIVVKGLTSPAGEIAQSNIEQPFWVGFIEGYGMMDLLGTYFFSSVTLASLRAHFPQEKNNKTLAWYALEASIVGAVLLALVYVGFALVAAKYSSVLDNVSSEVFIGTLAKNVLGSAGGYIVSTAVALACLTTAITLAVVFAEFVQRQVFSNAISYNTALVVTLLVTVYFSNQGFAKIVAMVKPILIIGYPVILFFTILNVIYKWTGMKWVTAPLLLATGVSLWWHQSVFLSIFGI